MVTSVGLDPEIILFGDSRWDKALSQWKKAKYFGFDIETYGDLDGDGLNPWAGRIRLIQIGLSSGSTLVYDLGGGKYQKGLDYSFLSVLAERLANPHVKVIGHNLKFDCLWMLVKYGIKTRTVRDTYLCSQLYWAGISGYGHGLKDLCERLGIGGDEGIDKTHQRSDWGASELSVDQINYAARDTHYALDCFRKLGLMLKEANLMGNAIAECMALPAFVEMEAYGMPLDRKMLEGMLGQYQAAADDLIAVFHEEFPGSLLGRDTDQLALFSMAPEKVNPDSHQQVVEAINAKHGLDIASSSQEALAPHWDKPGIKELSLWRTVRNAMEYIKGCLDAEFDGAVRGAYRQFAPKGFGRSTCGDDKKSTRKGVNLQNPPARLPPELDKYNLPKIRAAFRPAEGYSLLVSDLSQAHARIACEASQDPNLLASYNDDIDVHCLTGSTMAKQDGLGDDWTPQNIDKWRSDKSHPNSKKAKRFRTLAKPVFYGCVPIEDSQALTREGWKFHHELTVGEEILAYNPESGFTEFTPIRELFFYEDAPVVRLKSGNGINNYEDNDNGTSWTIRCTENHRWFGDRKLRRGPQIAPGKGKAFQHVEGFFTTEECTRNGTRILVSAPYIGGEGADHPDFLEHGAILEKYDRNWISDVLRMTPGERNWFLQAFLLGEGHLVKSETGKVTTWGFAQNPGTIFEAFHLAAFLQGKRVSVSYDKYRSEKSHKSNFDTMRVKIFNGQSSRSNVKRKPVVTGQKMVKVPSGRSDVWCPRTDFGTWVLRQGNTITITGNSLNCQGAATLQSTAQTEGVEMSLEEAKSSINAWRDTYEGLYRFQHNIVRMATKTHFEFEGIKTQFGFGEIRGLSGRRIFMLKFPNKFRPDAPPSVKLSDACAFYWTSTEADIVKLAAGWFLLHADRHPEWEASIRNCCHDELDVVCKSEYALEVAKLLQLAMRGAMRLFIKSIPVDDMKTHYESSIVKDWSEK